MSATIQDVMRRFKNREIQQEEALKLIGKVIERDRKITEEATRAIDEVLGMASNLGAEDETLGRAWEASRGRR